jgi:hypothetical protein
MPAAGITWANAIPYLLVTIVLTLLGSTATAWLTFRGTVRKSRDDRATHFDRRVDEELDDVRSANKELRAETSRVWADLRAREAEHLAEIRRIEAELRKTERDRFALQLAFDQIRAGADPTEFGPDGRPI